MLFVGPWTCGIFFLFFATNVHVTWIFLARSRCELTKAFAGALSRGSLHGHTYAYICLSSLLPLTHYELWIVDNESEKSPRGCAKNWVDPGGKPGTRACPWPRLNNSLPWTGRPPNSVFWIQKSTLSIRKKWTPKVSQVSKQLFPVIKRSSSVDTLGKDLIEMSSHRCSISSSLQEKRQAENCYLFRCFFVTQIGLGYHSFFLGTCPLMRKGSFVWFFFLWRKPWQQAKKSFLCQSQQRPLKNRRHFNHVRGAL